MIARISKDAGKDLFKVDEGFRENIAAEFGEGMKKDMLRSLTLLAWKCYVDFPKSGALSQSMAMMVSEKSSECHFIRCMDELKEAIAEASGCEGKDVFFVCVSYSSDASIVVMTIKKTEKIEVE